MWVCTHIFFRTVSKFLWKWHWSNNNNDYYWRNCGPNKKRCSLQRLYSLQPCSIVDRNNWKIGYIVCFSRIFVHWNVHSLVMVHLNCSWMKFTWNITVWLCCDCQFNLLFLFVSMHLHWSVWYMCLLVFFSLLPLRVGFFCVIRMAVSGKCIRQSSEHTRNNYHHWISHTRERALMKR